VGVGPASEAVVTATDLCDSTEELPQQVAGAMNAVIYEALRLLRRKPGQARKIRHLVNYLLEERGEQPNAFLYEACITANWDTATGSSDELRIITEKLSDAKIQFSSGIYHSALRVCF
jgi:hypothetical protein